MTHLGRCPFHDRSHLCGRVPTLAPPAPSLDSPQRSSISCTIDGSTPHATQHLASAMMFPADVSCILWQVAKWIVTEAPECRLTPEVQLAECVALESTDGIHRHVRPITVGAAHATCKPALAVVTERKITTQDP